MIIRTPTALGAAMRDRRRRLGLDQSDIARKVGVSRQWVVAVEKGKPGAEIGLVLRALNALDLDLSLEPRTTVKQDRDDGSDTRDMGIDIDAIVRKARRPRR